MRVCSTATSAGCRREPYRHPFFRLFWTLVYHSKPTKLDGVGYNLSGHTSCVFRFEPQSPKSGNIKVRKKWGFRQSQKEHQKVRKTALFVYFCAKRAVFAHFLVLFLKLAETPLFAHFYVSTFWALGLEPKYTTQFTFVRSHAVSPGFLGVHSQVLFATRTPNSHNHSYVHYSLSKFTGERFTNHSNHIYKFTPITRIVATKVMIDEYPFVLI